MAQNEKTYSELEKDLDKAKLDLLKAMVEAHVIGFNDGPFEYEGNRYGLSVSLEKHDEN
jgi:hypothetical protein